MIKSHQICPVCQKQLINSTKLAQSCPLINKFRFSFIESICNHSNISDCGYHLPSHLFFQISDLYEERLLEKISFPEKYVEIEVNYILHLTTLNYFERPPSTEFKTIKLENRLIELDYPDLKNVINKIKTIGLFS